MSGQLQLGYLALEVPDPQAWAAFAGHHLGLLAQPTKDHVHLRMDALQQRFTLTTGPADDVTAVGLLVANDKTCDELADRARANGGEVHEEPDEYARLRRVKRVVSLVDPAGLRVELATGPFPSAVPYSSPLVPGGYVTGAEGLGHAVLMVDDLDKTLPFWTGVLGFRLSDTSSHQTPAGESNAYFLHCNTRHHSIALVQRPDNSTYPRKLLHFMVEAVSMDTVGMGYDRAIDAGLTINRSLGKHPNDRMLSFYATTPSGFDFELGWGGAKVDDAWPTAHYDHISAWGHRKLGKVVTDRG